MPRRCERSVKSSISETAAFVKCSRAAVINLCREWIPKQKTRFQCQASGRHRLLLARKGELRKFNRKATGCQIVGNLNQGATANVSERTVHRTLHCKGYCSWWSLY
ncbi:hypothetical protein TNCV_3239201 [Trichonephila clavipes]|nr:hypothetical protein TNCV_3239201 [Trichonephila clavipes]